MRKLLIPHPLEQEFATVAAVWRSDGETRRVDALLLSWIKYEKQLRRLFCFLVFQHSKITVNTIDEVIDAIAQSRRLYPETFIVGIDILSRVSVRELIGSRYEDLSKSLVTIKAYRNKLMHGQLTGLGIPSYRLERDVLSIVAWISCLAEGAEKHFGYDGLRRRTFSEAKSSTKFAVESYPFSTAKEFKEWLDKRIVLPPKGSL